MFYKITNTESELFKALFDLRKREKEYDERNEKKLIELFGSSWGQYFGHTGQSSFYRVKKYEGFAFLEPHKLKDPGAWKSSTDKKGLYFPNRKTKKGREIHRLLLNGLEVSSLFEVFEILGLDSPTGRFKFPYVFAFKDVILVTLGDVELTHKDVEEITYKEFDSIRDDKFNRFQLNG